MRWFNHTHSDGNFSENDIGRDIITSFSNKYALTRGEIIPEIETVFSSILSQWYRMEVLVFFREDFRMEAIAYDHTGGIIMQKPVDLSKKERSHHSQKATGNASG